MNNNITKEQKIKYLIDLLKSCDNDYVESVFQVLLNEDLTYIPNMLGDNDWEALKTMILNEDID